MQIEKRTIICASIFLVLAVISLPNANADSVTLTASGSTYVQESTPTTNYYGSNPFVRGDTGAVERVYSKFNLSTISAGTIITNVYLNVTSFDVDYCSLGSGTVNIYQTGNINEKTLTWNTQPTRNTSLLSAYSTQIYDIVCAIPNNSYKMISTINIINAVQKAIDEQVGYIVFEWQDIAENTGAARYGYFRNTTKLIITYQSGSLSTSIGSVNPVTQNSTANIITQNSTQLEQNAKRLASGTNNFLIIAQAGAYGTQLSNASVSVKYVAVNDNQVNLALAIYTCSISIPSISYCADNSVNDDYPATLQSYRVWTLANETTNVNLNYNPALNIAANQMYIISLQTDRDGVYIYFSTGNPTIKEDLTDGKLQVSGATILAPTTLTSYIYSSVNIAFGLLGSYQQAVTSTTTITYTTTIGSTATTTITTTRTAIVNQSDPTDANYWFMPLIFLFIPTGILMGVGKTANVQGHSFVILFLVGLTLGSWMGTFANIIPYGFTLFITVITAIVIWRS